MKKFFFCFLHVFFLIYTLNASKVIEDRDPFFRIKQNISDFIVTLESWENSLKDENEFLDWLQINSPCETISGNEHLGHLYSVERYLRIEEIFSLTCNLKILNENLIYQQEITDVYWLNKLRNYLVDVSEHYDNMVTVVGNDHLYISTCSELLGNLLEISLSTSIESGICLPNKAFEMTFNTLLRKQRYMCDLFQIAKTYITNNLEIDDSFASGYFQLDEKINECLDDLCSEGIVIGERLSCLQILLEDYHHTQSENRVRIEEEDLQENVVVDGYIKDYMKALSKQMKKLIFGVDKLKVNELIKILKKLGFNVSKKNKKGSVKITNRHESPFVQENTPYRNLNIGFHLPHFKEGLNPIVPHGYLKVLKYAFMSKLHLSLES